MPSYLIDSDVLIDFFKKKPYAVETISFLAGQRKLIVSVLSIAELRAGWSEKQARFFLPRLYKLVEIKGVSKDVAELAGEIRRKYKKRGTILPTIDTIIGATCILEDSCLITRNKKHYPMRQIQFYNLLNQK